MPTYQIQARDDHSTRVIADGYSTRDGLVEFVESNSRPGTKGEIVFAMPTENLIYIKRLDTAQGQLEDRIKFLESSMYKISRAQPAGSDADAVAILKQMANEALFSVR